MDKTIIILGARGNSIDILDTIKDINIRNNNLYCVGFLDDSSMLQSTTVYNLPILGKLKDAIKFQHTFFVNSIGSPKNYTQKQNIIRSSGLKDHQFLSIISPYAYIARSAKIGHGSIALVGSVIAAEASIGNHVMVLQNTIINHNTIVEDFVSLAAGVSIAGDCYIKQGAYIGTNACIRGGITIGEYALIGMGAVVTKDVKPGATVVGNPAKILHKI